MAVFKCKMCGGNLNVEKGQTVCTCEYCGTEQTVSSANDEIVTNLFNRANNLRLKSEFDKAQEIYEKIVSVDPNDAEAYWGIVLCKYGIEYVEDPKTFERIPTCHRTQLESVMTDIDYLSAIKYADSNQRLIYEAEAKRIDKLQKDILSIVNKEKPFDVFICYKETDDNGKRTVDSSMANDIYYQLTKEGFKVFYAAITLEDKIGQEYEPYIFAALNSAKVMLIIGTKPEYFNSVWVKNEWSRYIKLMKDNREKTLIPCYKNMDAYDLPEEFAHIQAQDMSKIGFMADLIRGVKKIVRGSASEKSEAPTNSKSEGETGSLLKRAYLFLEDGDWDNAVAYCERVLDANPECAEAYLGELMADLKVNKPELLKDCKLPFNDNGYYKKVIRFADDKLKNKLTEYIDYINERNENARKNNILAQGKEIMNGDSIENYQAAINLFKSIPGWKDADEQIIVCEDKIREIEAKDEAEKRENERKAEIARQEAERKAKKKKKIAIISAVLICVIIAFILILTKAIIPSVNYNKAMDLYQSGDLENAYTAFYDLGDYKDSVNIAKSIQFKVVKPGNYIRFGKYEQDNDASNGQEDIEWRVLDKQENKILVISKYALDCIPYNTDYTDVTWETCSLRSWLNNDFINTAFNDKEKAMIPTVKVTADKNPSYDTNPGSKTKDKVFLLSITEAEKYFSSDNDRACKCTAYAQTNGEYTVDGFCYWWLRTPGNYQSYAAYVYSDGAFYERGDTVDTSSYAVRPAMWIEIK